MEDAICTIDEGNATQGTMPWKD